MYKGQCLCGSVTWKLLAEPYAIYNCHCRMCQKVHGAAFGTYCFVKSNEFSWTCETDTIVHYASSETVTRSSCNKCGAVVPYVSGADASGRDRHWVAPGGCHDDMRKPDYNIFVADNAPWHTISGGLPECNEYPEASGQASVAGVPPPGKAKGAMRGSCLCGAVNYKVTEPFKTAHNCHCSRCRHGRSAAHATNGFVSCDGVEYLGGEEHLREYKVPEAKFFTQVFCEICSSLMPRKDSDRGISVIPMSSLDDDPLIRPVDHIFVNYKAEWHDITDDLPQFPEFPPSA